jgi:hypothetical protein
MIFATENTEGTPRQSRNQILDFGFWNEDEENNKFHM